MQIPVTVFTGFLGAGKTTIIINLLKQMPKSYKMVMLKNEFGNVEVDSKLMQDSNIKVTEMLNGCLCCILVGKLGNALDEILQKYTPDHILIETSGSAYPAPIAWELNKMKDRLKLDGIVTIIDAKNFTGYRDISYTAKIQAQYTDLILINKHEGLSEHELDKVLDDVYELNATTPKIKTDKGNISADLVFGLNSKLFLTQHQVDVHEDQDHHHKEVEIIELHSQKEFDKDKFVAVIKALPKWDFYRIKGILKLKDKSLLINCAFGDIELIEAHEQAQETAITFMGKNMKFHLQELKKDLGVDDDELKMLD
jgi:G3E family GTPase